MKKKEKLINFVRDLLKKGKIDGFEATSGEIMVNKDFGNQGKPALVQICINNKFIEDKTIEELREELKQRLKKYYKTYNLKY